MSATTSTFETGTVSVPQTRRRVLGFIFLGVAAFIWLAFLRVVDPMMDTTMRLYPGGSTVVVDDWVFNTQAMLWVMAAGCAAVGAFQLVRGFGRRTGLAFGVVGGMFVFAFLSWAATGGTLNLAGMLRIMVVRSVPLTLGALADLKLWAHFRVFRAGAGPRTLHYTFFVEGGDISLAETLLRPE